MVLSQPVAPGRHRAQPAPEHAGARAATCPSHAPQLPRAGCLGCDLPSRFPAEVPRLRGTQQPRSAQERCGAGLQCSTRTMLSLRPPGSLIKRSAAARLPRPAKSNHVAEARLETLNGTEARRGRRASPRRAAPLWPQTRCGLQGSPGPRQLPRNPASSPPTQRAPRRSSPRDSWDASGNPSVPQQHCSQQPALPAPTPSPAAGTNGQVLVEPSQSL